MGVEESSNKPDLRLCGEADVLKVNAWRAEHSKKTRILVGELSRKIYATGQMLELATCSGELGGEVCRLP